MSNRLAILVCVVLLAFFSFRFLPSTALELLPEDQQSFWEYRLVGDRVLLKNPSSRVERIPSVCKGRDGLGTAWWGDDVRLTWADSSDAILPSLASKDTYLHIAWTDNRINLLFDIFYKRSTDLGHTWEEDVQISDAPERVQESSPDITVSANCLHAVWGYFIKPHSEQGHIYYRRSPDNGETWEDILFLSSYEHQSKPSIAVLGDTVYVVFTRTIDQPEAYETHFRKSCDEGATWTEDRVIADYYASLVRGTLRADEHGLHYVFNHKDNFDDPGNPYRSQEIFYIYSPDFGETWTDPIIVSHRDSIHSQWPSMCVDDEGTVHVTWFDYKTSPYSWTGDIFYTKSTDKSTDDGQFWSEIQVLTDTHLTRWSNIIARGNHIYLVFEDERHGNHNNEVYFRHSLDRGEAWQPEERLTYAHNESYTPVITEQADTLYVVWEDSRHDTTVRQSELYFKRGGFEAISIKKSPPAEHSLYLSSYPNPFNDELLIRYSVPYWSRISLAMYDLLGRKVAELVSGYKDGGVHTVRWDGRDSGGRSLSSGLYFCLFEFASERKQVAKIVLIR